MKIDVGYVAELARLELNDEENPALRPQFENVVKCVHAIGEGTSVHGGRQSSDTIFRLYDRGCVAAVAPGVFVTRIPNP